MRGDSREKIVTMNGKVYCVRFEEGYVRVASVVKQEVDLLNELDVSTVHHCDGLLLCVGEDEKKEEPKLVLWNPHLSQTRRVKPRQNFDRKDSYAIGYDDSEGEGGRNHKILRFVSSYTRIPELACENHYVSSEIYEVRSNSWRVLDVLKDPEWRIEFGHRGVSVKGNTYFFADHLVKIPGTLHRGSFQTELHVFLVCFDFAKEKFGPRLPLPFHHSSYDGFKGDVVTLSSFLRGDDDEQLAVLFGGYESGFFEIWVTLSVDPNRGASWSKFLRMEPGPFCGYGFKLVSSSSGGSFFVDEKNRLAVLFELYEPSNHKSFNKAFLFVQDRFKSSVFLGEAAILQYRAIITNGNGNGLYKAARPPVVCSSPYRPSSVPVNHLPVHTRKCMSPSATQKST